MPCWRNTRLEAAQKDPFGTLLVVQKPRKWICFFLLLFLAACGVRALTAYELLQPHRPFSLFVPVWGVCSQGGQRRVAVNAPAHVESEHHQAAASVPAWLGIGVVCAPWLVAKPALASLRPCARPSRWMGLTSVVSTAV